MKSITILVLLLSISDGSPRTVCDPNVDADFRNSHVGLIISPLMSKTVIREIEVYWNHGNYRSGDTIALYTQEPAEGVKPIYSFVPGARSGIKKSGIQAEFVPTSKLTFVRQCLKYHVAWLRDGSIKLSNCLETRPNWMFERKEILGPLTMNKVFLPGTHDSASYVISERARSENLVERYMMTQDVDVLGQLIYGVRYLDIRVGYYPNLDITWWANHAILRSVPLQKVVNDVKTFLDNTQEIVVFDVQEFPVGFNGNISIHDSLVAYLEKEFRNYYLTKYYGWGSSLDSIWSSGRRLIIGYDNARVVNRHDSIWPCVTHQWGNVRTINDLYRYLDRIETRGSYGNITPRSAMAELTPNTLDVILNRLGGLRQMAENVNANVTYWYTTKWQHTANIVAVDFVRSSGIIETAIEWNERRRKNC